MIRFLHAADLHLDSPLRDLEKYEGAPVERIRGASRKALENLVGLANDERVDFVVLAGDIYDGDWHDVGTGLFFVKQMAKLKTANIPVFVIAGNHDAANKMSRRLPYPDNVRVFCHDRPETFTLDNIGVALHGQSYADQAESRNLALGYPAAVKGMINIGLLHTALTGREGHESYAPCQVEELLTRNYDYWALGHIHQRESVRRDEHPRVEFSGNIQGRHIREEGPKGCLIATVNRVGTISTEFRPLDVVRWQRVQVSCRDAANRDAVFALVSEGLTNALTSADDRLLAVRVELVGECPCHDDLLADSRTIRDDIIALAKACGDEALWIEKVHVRTQRPSVGAVQEIGDDALSEFAAVAAELSDDSTKLREIFAMDDIKALAAKIPPDLKEGVAALAFDDPAWTRTLIDRARAVLVQAATRKEPGR